MRTSQKPLKQKKCRICKEQFVPVRSLQVVCSPDCAFVIANQKAEAKKRKDATKQRQELRHAKKEAKTRGEWVKDAQFAFNAFIRARDSDKGCISCGVRFDRQMHAGHFRTTKAAPELRFNEENCHKQCSICNNHLSGNLLEYRRNLITRIGLDRVLYLEGPVQPQHYTIDDLKQIIATYRAKLKEITKNEYPSS